MARKIEQDSATVITAESTYVPPTEDVILADAPTDSTPAIPANLNMNDPTVLAALFKSLGLAVGEGMKATTRPKMTFGECSQREAAKKHKLTVTAFQNDKQVSATQLTNAEIDLLNRVSRSGRYIERQVEVIFNDTSGERIVLLRYNDATADDRFRMRGDVRNFEDMMRQIVTAQDAENAEDEAQRDAIAEIRRNKKRA